MKDIFLSTEEAAVYLSYKPGTLENWRSNKEGPKYLKPAGKVLYRKEDLDNWLVENFNFEK